MFAIKKHLCIPKSSQIDLCYTSSQGFSESLSYDQPRPSVRKKFWIGQNTFSNLWYFRGEIWDIDKLIKVSFKL